MEKGEKIRRFLLPVGMLLCVVLLVWYLVALQGRDRQSNAALSDVAAAVVATLDETGFQESDAQMVKRLYGLNPAEYDGVVLYAPVTNMDAQELLIVKLQDVAQQDAVEAAVQARLKTQKASFDGYGAEQSALLEKAVVDVEGNYVLFVVGEQAAAAQSAFLQAL